MSWLTRTRDSLVGLALRSYFTDNVSPKDPIMTMIWGSGTKTKAGQIVTEGNALKLAPFFSAVSLLASSVATLPLSMPLKVKVEGEPNKDHYTSSYLTTKPNPWFTPYWMKDWMIWRAIVRGNAYIQIDRDAGYVDALWPLEPDNVEPQLNAEGQKEYKYTYKDEHGQEHVKIIPIGDMIHIPGFCYDGMKGLGILDFAKESIGSGLAVDEFGARFFAGDGQATGIITHPQRLQKPSKINIKESYKEQSKGVETASASNGRGVVVLDEGMTYQRTGLTPEEGQFLGTRGFTVEEMCRWLHIPPFMMAIVTGATSLSAEEQSEFFLKYGLKPWLDRITEELNVKLLDKDSREMYAAKFDTDALAVMTQDKQLANFSSARNMGLLTLNDISRKMNWPVFKDKPTDDEGNSSGVSAGDQRVGPSTMKVLGDTDPSTPVPIQTMTGYIDMIRNNRDLTKSQALAMGKLLMPTVDDKLLKKFIKPFIGKDDGLDDDDWDDGKTGDKSGNSPGVKPPDKLPNSNPNVDPSKGGRGHTKPPQQSGSGDGTK